MICTSIPQPLYWFFSEGVPPLLYYSHFTSIIVALLVSFFIFFKSNSLTSKILLGITVSFILWTFFSLILWTNINTGMIYFLWSLFGLIQGLISVFSIYFMYVFIDEKDISFRKKSLLALILLPIIVLTPTNFNLNGFNYELCGSSGFENIYFVWYYTLTGLFAIIWINGILIARYKKLVTLARKKAVIVAVGLNLFLISFFVASFLGSYLNDIGATSDYSLEFYGLFGMTAFLAFLSFVIVRYKAFNIKLLGAQALVWALIILIGSEFFFVESTINKILIGITLAISTISGLMIIRSVKRLEQQKEQISGYVQDLSKLNSELVFKNNRLKELDQQKTEFVSLATHQLRSPLTAMKGYASLILEGDFGQVSDEVKKAVQVVLDSANTLVNIVNDYLNVSRIELGSMKYYFNKMDFKQIVETVIAELKPNVERAGLTLSFTAEPGANFETMVDEDKIKQVIANTLDNAQKYTKAGSISINLSVITNDKNEKKIIYSIKDTGFGIDSKVMPKLFTKFTRAEGANAINIRGTGLGLYVAKEIVTAHKGRIWAESEGEGKGSQFYVELPIA